MVIAPYDREFLDVEPTIFQFLHRILGAGMLTENCSYGVAWIAFCCRINHLQLPFARSVQTLRFLLSDELMLGRILASCNPTFVLVGITVVTYQFEYIGDRDSETFDGAKAIP